MNLTLNIYHDVRRGGRNYMEDVISIVAYDKNEAELNNSYPFACFLVFDGHGGVEAAKFAEANLLNQIKAQEGFNSDDDEIVIKAIKNGFLSTHKLMWKVVETWPKTQHGLPSTSGTTASLVLIRKGKLYVAHVGDSTVIIGEHGNDFCWKAKVLTTDHKPDSPKERKRIEKSGGEVMWKSGVPRVVWRRERTIKLSTKKVSTVDCVPFLAVARSLGDLWSYNENTDAYSVSPEPDISVHEIDLSVMKCLILASDGLWNVLSAGETVKIVKRSIEGSEAPHQLNGPFSWMQLVSFDEIVTSTRDPATALVDVVLAKCRSRFLRADNTSAIVILFDEDKSDICNVNKVDCNESGSPNHWNINVNILSKPKSPCASVCNGTKDISINTNTSLLSSLFNTVTSVTNCLKKTKSETPVFDSLYNKYFTKNNKVLDDNSNMKTDVQSDYKAISLPQISSFVKMKNLNESISCTESPMKGSPSSSGIHKPGLGDAPEIQNMAVDGMPTNGNDEKCDPTVSVFNLFEICKSASQHDESSLFSDNIIPQVPVCFINDKDNGQDNSDSTTDNSCSNFVVQFNNEVSDVYYDKTNVTDNSILIEDPSLDFSLLHSVSTTNTIDSKDTRTLFKITYPLESASKSLYTKLKKRKSDSDIVETSTNMQISHFNSRWKEGSNLSNTSDNILNFSTNKEDITNESNISIKFRSGSPSSSSSSDKDGKDEDDEEVNEFINIPDRSLLSTSGLKKTALKSVSSACKRKLHSNYMCRRHRKQKLHTRLITTTSTHSNTQPHSLTDFVRVYKNRLQLRRVQVCS